MPAYAGPFPGAIRRSAEGTGSSTVAAGGLTFRSAENSPIRRTISVTSVSPAIPFTFREAPARNVSCCSQTELWT